MRNDNDKDRRGMRVFRDRTVYGLGRTRSSDPSGRVTGYHLYPYAQPYRDPDNPERPIPQWQKDMAGWVNKKQHFEPFPFKEFRPRKNFKCEQYFLETFYR